jgi:hypothetical protein
MSNFLRRTRHPKTGQFETAEWLDNYYANRVYGVRFPDSPTVYHQLAREWEFDGEGYALSFDNELDPPPELGPQRVMEDTDND